jgi:hypothetical protein
MLNAKLQGKFPKVSASWVFGGGEYVIRCPSREEGYVRVIGCDRMKKIRDIPILQVSPKRPTLGEKAVIIFGPDIGVEGVVQVADGDEWTLVTSSSPPLSYTISPEHLCVVQELRK